MATSGQFSWPPAGSFVAAYGQFLVAVVMPALRDALNGMSPPKRQINQRFEADARRAGLAEPSVRTYVHRSGIFVRWLAGNYQFQGPRS
jgi:hypothetical protein